MAERFKQYNPNLSTQNQLILNKSNNFLPIVLGRISFPCFSSILHKHSLSYYQLLSSLATTIAFFQPVVILL